MFRTKFENSGMSENVPQILPPQSLISYLKPPALSGYLATFVSAYPAMVCRFLPYPPISYWLATDLVGDNTIVFLVFSKKFRLLEDLVNIKSDIGATLHGGPILISCNFK